MSSIVFPSSFNSKNIAFSAPKQLPSGAKQAYLNYSSQKLIMQTATEMSIPFGLNIADKFGPPEYSVELSFRGHEQNAEIKKFMEVISQIDEKLLEEGVKNSKTWFKADLSKDVIKAFYTPSLKYSKDKEGNVLTYPPNIKLKLRKTSKTNETKSNDSKLTISDLETKFYDTNGKPYTDIPIEDLLAKGVQVTAIIECAGVWFAGSKFGLTWRAKQIAVHKLPKKLEDFAFKGLSAKVQDESENDNEENEINDEDAFRTPVQSVPSAVSSVMPDATPDETPEEEEDFEPIPAPKKTLIKKKPIVRAK
jgi:hypothetical protein